MDSETKKKTGLNPVSVVGQFLTLNGFQLPRDIKRRNIRVLRDSCPQRLHNALFSGVLACQPDKLIGVFVVAVQPAPNAVKRGINLDADCRIVVAQAVFDVLKDSVAPVYVFLVLRVNPVVHAVQVGVVVGLVFALGNVEIQNVHQRTPKRGGFEGTNLAPQGTNIGQGSQSVKVTASLEIQSGHSHYKYLLKIPESG